MGLQVINGTPKIEIIDQFLKQAIKVEVGNLNKGDFSDVRILGFETYDFNSETGIKVAHTLKEDFDQSSFYFESEAGLIIFYEIFTWLSNRPSVNLWHWEIVSHLMKTMPKLQGTTIKFRNYIISFSIPMCVYEDVHTLTFGNLGSSKITKLTMEEFMNVNVSLVQHIDDIPGPSFSNQQLAGTPIEDEVERIIEETEREIAKTKVEPKELKEVINVSSEMGNHTIQFHKDFLSKEDRDKFLKDLLKIL